MILQRARDLSALVREAHQLEAAQRDASDLQATHKALLDVATRVQDLYAVARVAQEYLSRQELDEVRSQLSELLKRLRASQDQFHTQMKQASVLAQLTARITTLQSQMDAVWTAHAETILRPHLELLDLVRSLPEVQTQAARLDTLERTLRAATVKAPRDSQHLARFHADIAALDDCLGALHTLSPAIQQFLYRVGDGHATLADLTDEVLAWCRTGSRAWTFRIQFHRPAAERSPR